MTRRHFIAVAAAIAEQRQQATTDGERERIDALARALCAEFKIANRQFSQDRFLTACGTP